MLGDIGPLAGTVYCDGGGRRGKGGWKPRRGIGAVWSSLGEDG
jgi:hypothetical protein